MERLRTQPDVMKEILSYLTPNELISVKITEKKLTPYVKTGLKDKKILDSLTDIAILISYHVLFNEFYFTTNNDIESVISANDISRFRKGEKKFLAYSIQLDRTDDEFNLTLSKYDEREEIRNPNMDKTLFLISKLLFDPTYREFPYSETTITSVNEFGDSLNSVQLKTNEISDIMNELIETGDIHQYLEKREFPVGNLYNFIVKKYRNLVKSMIQE
jgi:hypothetical protein